MSHPLLCMTPHDSNVQPFIFPDKSIKNKLILLLLNHFTMRLLLALTSLALTSTCTEAATSEAWRDRVVYQILTDRFSAEANPGEACEGLRGFCGGTYRGLASKLDYLQVKEEFLHGQSVE